MAQLAPPACAGGAIAEAHTQVCAAQTDSLMCHLWVCVQGWHHSAVMARLSSMLRSPTAKVLDMLPPHLIELDGINMPDRLNFEFEISWIHTSVLEAALVIVEGKDRLVYREAPGVAGVRAPETFYILTTTDPAWRGERIRFSLVERYAMLRPTLHTGPVANSVPTVWTYLPLLVCRYKKLCEGEVGRGKRAKTWEMMVQLKNSMHRVQRASAEHCSVTCKANPYHLVCRGCKPYASTGYCKHVAAVTHIIEEGKAADERDPLLDIRARLAPLNRLKRPTAGLLEDGSGSGGIRRRGRRQARWEKRNSKVKNTEGGQGKGQGLQEHSGVRGGGVRKAGRGTGAGTSHRSGAMSGVRTMEDAEREANRKAVAAWPVQVRRKSVAQHQRATAGSNEGSRAAGPGPASFDEIFYGVLGKMLMRNQVEARQRGDTAGNQPLPQPLPSAGVRTQWNLPPLTGERQNRP